MRLSTVILIIGLVTSFSVVASISSNKHEQEKSKLAEIEAVARAGNIDAQLFLAHAYLEGYEGISKNIPVGLDWLKMAAVDSKPEIQEYLGEIFHYGHYGDKDFEKAIFWYKKSAANNYASAMDYVGLFYSGGLGGLKQDCGKAKLWYEKANNAGYTQSKANIVWILATCPDKKYRDGAKAISMALEIISSKKEVTAGDLDNLAAAYAEQDNFEMAIKTQLEAIALLDPVKESSRLKKHKLRLELYENRKKWRGSSNASPEDYGQE